ncbi:MAG TPA: hypothetical protein VG265_00340 [Gaiellaceae bacterium]|jgi:hypothetical protein|nr:hypothetical protein [Gaiellaceae bacterium]
MTLTTYRYELREGDSVLATGHISFELPLEVGDPVEVGRRRGVVRDLGPRDANGETRLVVQLTPNE